jgi:lipase ATG15
MKYINLKFVSTIYNLYNGSNTSNPDFNSQSISFNFDEENLTSYSNIYNLAEMSYNAYTYINNTEWDKIPYNKTDLPDIQDTIKGYIFSDNDDKNVIIAIKGTSLYWTRRQRSAGFDLLSSQIDKFNDNLFLSCCYYKQSSIFNGLCKDPNKEDHVCLKECYQNSTLFELNYFKIAKQIIENLKSNRIIDFERSNIVFTGHSLGGVIATYLGVIYDRPVITFEAPGEKYYFDLIDLDYSKAKNIYHYGHNADIIFTGKCNGINSYCYIGGYIIRTKCHIGKTCMYDSVNKLKFSESLWNHRLRIIIDKIIPHWLNDPPICQEQIDCIDCEKWKHV